MAFLSIIMKAFIVSILFINTHSFNQTCDAKNECEKILKCPDNEPDCYINCLAFKSCAGALVDCGTSTNCNLRCSGDMACDELEIICPSDAICNINCVSEESLSCVDINVVSNTNTITNIRCAGDHSCYAGNIHCDDSAQCNLQCFGSYACSGPSSAPFSIYGDRSNNLTISECIGGTASCKDLNVFCPFDVNVPVAPRCFLPGQGIFNERKVDGYVTKITSGGIDIYAVHSWHDVVITDYAPDNLISGTMFCGTNTSHWCNITDSNDAWDCADDMSLCSTTVYQEPTKEPTMEPTLDPTGNPTVNPTIDPTVSPTEEPTLDPTHDPTTEPTEPSDAPSRSPTIEPTADPTASPSRVINSQQRPTDPTASAQYGLLVALILFVFFICLMICGWRYWNKGNDLDHTEQSQSMLGKATKRRNDKKIQLDDHDSDSMEDHREKGHNIHRDESQMKPQKKKKKRRNKKQIITDDANAGHYQKHTDDPFESNQWTELTQFD